MNSTEPNTWVTDALARLAAVEAVLPLVEVGLDGNVLALNDTFGALLGICAHAALGRGYALLLTEAEREGPEWTRFWKRLIAAGKAGARLAHAGPNGAPMMLDVAGAVVTGGDAGTVKFLFVARAGATSVQHNRMPVDVSRFPLNAKRGSGKRKGTLMASASFRAGADLPFPAGTM